MPECSPYRPSSCRKCSHELSKFQFYTLVFLVGYLPLATASRSSGPLSGMEQGTNSKVTKNTYISFKNDSAFSIAPTPTIFKQISNYQTLKLLNHLIEKGFKINSPVFGAFFHKKVNTKAVSH